MAYLEIKNFSKSFGRNHVIKDINLDFDSIKEGIVKAILADQANNPSFKLNLTTAALEELVDKDLEVIKMIDFDGRKGIWIVYDRDLDTFITTYPEVKNMGFKIGNLSFFRVPK